MSVEIESTVLSRLSKRTYSDARGYSLEEVLSHEHVLSQGELHLDGEETNIETPCLVIEACGIRSINVGFSLEHPAFRAIAKPEGASVLVNVLYSLR